MVFLIPREIETSCSLQSNALSDQIEIVVLQLLRVHLRCHASPPSNDEELERPNFLSGYPSFLKTPLHD